MSDQTKVLVVEDNSTMRHLLTEVLEIAGFKVRGASTAREMTRVLQRDETDLVLLDLGLPDADGVNLITQIQQRKHLPLVVVSARAHSAERVLCLESGADDYVTKPFENRELLARVRAVLRRCEQRDAGQGVSAILFGQWELNLVEERLFAPNGDTVPLTPNEFVFLRLLAESNGAPRTRDELMLKIANRAWSKNDRTIDVLATKLRKKIENDPANPAIIQTVRGVGYRLGVRARRALIQ